ncbi:MAG: biopolymer transporter ExbD [Capsulimonadales bacterium]|nr:biopolymer transporter ExbD [Capsulimonadales bacterium]
MRLPQQPARKGRIEIIPMIDAIFFLLVFFIMTSLSMIRLETHGATLPGSRTTVAQSLTGDRLVVVLRRDQAIFVDKNPASEADVLRIVRERVAATPDLPVLLTADREADVTRFLRLFDLVKQADARNVIVATELTPSAPTRGN